MENNRKTVPVQTNVPPEVYERIKAAAEKDERSISYWLRQMLVRLLDEQSAA